MREFLFVDPNMRHPITNEPGAPRVYFVVATPEYPNGCCEIVKDIRAQRRKAVEIAGDVKVFSDERDDKVRDHGYDMTKYALCMRPSPAGVPKAPPAPPGRISIVEYEQAGAQERRRRRREARSLGPGARRGWGSGS